ncbi:MAG: host attachment family protein [Pseudomonadota bacterium]
MPLPNKALVLVADGRKILFFRNHGDENQIDLRTEAHDEREDRYNREIRTDAQGASAHSAGVAGRGIGAQGGGHTSRPAMEETDFHQQEEDSWLKDAADELKKRVLRNDFEALAIIAPPKALGVLRKELHKEVERRVVCTINKEMSGRPIPDIEALLTSETSAEDLPAV